jgi:hypothetical protein
VQALAQQSDALQAALVQEESQIGNTRQKLNFLALVLIAWAVIMTATIAIVVSVVFAKLRHHSDDNPLGFWGADDHAESYVTGDEASDDVTDTKSCVSDFSPNFLDLDFGNNEAEEDDDVSDIARGVTRSGAWRGEGCRRVEISVDHSDVEVERVENFFNDEESLSSSPSSSNERTLPNFRSTNIPTYLR